ncbi:MAG: phosphohydrolase, partial [Candidatus Hydrothermota bacterium]
MGKEVEGEFYISRKEVRKKKDGGPYIELALADVTGSAPAVVFEDVETLDGVIREGNVFLIRGNVGSFNDSLQVKVVWARAVTEYDPRDYVKSTEKDIGLMEEKLLSIVDSVLDPYLKKLLDLFFRDEKFMRKFKLAPAAKKLHHAFIGGLLEHTLSVTELARVVASRYKEVNTDLLISGALLHDVGKTEEYGFFPMIELTDRGRLLGHLVIGYEMVSAKIEELRDYLGGFPEDTKMKILHMILSH